MRNPIFLVLAAIIIVFAVVKQRAAAQERARVAAVRDSTERAQRLAAVADRRRYDSIMAQREGVSEMAAGLMRAEAKMRLENQHRLECMRKQAPIRVKVGSEDRVIAYGDTAADCRQ